MQIGVAYSTFVPGDLARLVEAEYALVGPVTCSLVRRGFNDHYRVTAGSRRYFLRVYLRNKYWIRSASDFLFELNLLAHLKAHGVGVAAAVPRRDGSLMGSVGAPEGTRYFALFEAAPGTTASELTNEQCALFGDTVARFHLAADQFESAHSRYSLDPSYLIDGPLERLTPVVQRFVPESVPFLTELAESVRAQISRVPTTPGAWGLIHGDLHTGNCHFDATAGLTIFDFDHCGFGWRAYDLSAYLWGAPEEKREAFLQGYQAYRPLSEGEMQALPAFAKARLFWDNGDMLAFTANIGDAWITERHVKRIVKDLQELDEKYPS